jgi:hypothetical protein
MNYQEFLNRVIDEGIEAAKRDYARDDQKLKGSIAGFEACRNKIPDELGKILLAARENSDRARRLKFDGYWNIRCFELEVEWVCNVVSVMLMSQGQLSIITPSRRGLMKASEILGGRGQGNVSGSEGTSEQVM